MKCKDCGKETSENEVYCEYCIREMQEEINQLEFEDDNDWEDDYDEWDDEWYDSTLDFYDH